MDVLVTYDIATMNAAGERRLARIAAVCERYGVRAQYSVFECRLSPASLQTLIGELLDVIKSDEDSINIYRLERPMPEVRQSFGIRKPSLGQPWIMAPRTSGDP